MFPHLSNTEFFIFILTLWSIWFFLSTLHDIRQWGGQPPKKKGNRRQLKPQSPHDCELCRLGLHEPKPKGPRQVTPWPQIKNPSGRKKRSNSEGKACPRRCCDYYGITDSLVHALVSNGWRGKSERIRQWKCQACGGKFSDRRNTALYRLKTASQQVAQVMIAMAEGVDLSAATRIFRFHHTTVSRWMNRAGQHGQALHFLTFRNFVCEHLQLDELATRVKKSRDQVWLWTAVDAKSKVLLDMHLGGRKKQDAQTFIHRVIEKLATGCLPVFTSDGLRMYFYALTAHFGTWVWPEGARKFHWQTDENLLYGQFRKVRNGFRITNIYTIVQWGERQLIKKKLQAIGLTGKIQTSFVERLNLTLRELTAPLSRRTWSMAFDEAHLLVHVEWVRCYYHFARPHLSLKKELANGQTRYLTPAVAAGVAHRRYDVRELLLMSLYPDTG
ncbi:MAG: DDE-type integrase/transposase/recombinase [Chloroflexota bacterium]